MRGTSFIFGGDLVSKFLRQHDIDLVCKVRLSNKHMSFFSPRDS
jgi:hypothetical protein